ncbi:MAG: ATP-dependent Clp protease ATP-binding subunit, partial [Clostridia bacterium]|nr:ATP-dependent Clp protease ATP-binding subunit [Clostridia bacterium]
KLYKELEAVHKEQDEEAETTENTENFELVATLKTKACRLEEKIHELEEKIDNVPLTIQDVAAVIEGWTKIPAGQITKEESARLLDLENVLRKRVRGQEEAIQTVAAAMRRNRAGLSALHRPVSFIFTGQTGIGKTELARALAEALFDSEDSLIRMDMSEYMEKHAVSKIIGSPPGYVGYDDAGQLTEIIRRRPYSVILLDEIEKAHAEVLNIFLQILEDGRITDSHGKLISFENTVIIMTSNAGSDYKGAAPGYTAAPEEASKEKAEKALRSFFRPEFLNRVDEIVLFAPLGKKVLLEILNKMLDEFAVILKEKGMEFTITEEAKEFLLEKGLDEKNGARPLRRAISKNLEDKVAYLLISGDLNVGDGIVAEMENGALIVKNRKENV